MTLQLGLIGTDGIVIASDRQLQQQQIDGIEIGVSRSLTSKFRLGQNGVLGCWSGDKVAQLALDHFSHLGSTEIKESWEDSLVSLANDAWRALCANDASLGNQIRKVLVARPGAAWQLWVVDVGAKSFANPVLNKVVAGDIRNSARHVINSYFSEPYAPLPFKVRELIFAAAHTIVQAERENSTSVLGLEIVIVRNNHPPLFLAAEAIDALRARSEAMFRDVKASLVKPIDIDEEITMPPDSE